MAHIAVFSNMQEVKQAIEEHEKQVANRYVADDSQGKHFHDDGTSQLFPAHVPRCSSKRQNTLADISTKGTWPVS